MQSNGAWLNSTLLLLLLTQIDCMVLKQTRSLIFCLNSRLGTDIQGDISSRSTNSLFEMLCSPILSVLA